MKTLEYFGRRRLWIFAMAAMLVLVAIDTVSHVNTTLAVSAQHSIAPPAEDPSSPTGYQWGQRDLILPFTGLDAYHWVMQTQAMLAGAGARVRSVDYDNAPQGREVHWSSSVRWWLAAVAWVDHAYTGTPLPIAVEQVAPFADTLLIILILLAVVPLIARRFGPTPAALLAFGAVAVGPFYESFAEGRTDHHGLAAVIALLTVLFLAGGAAGWIRNETSGDSNSVLRAWLPNRRQARQWFIASGVVGGLGLWISTASEAPILAEVGLGALLATSWLGHGATAQDGARPDPKLWRVWGWSGAATSIFFYLVEYFPSHMGWRLEVNHPLYALAWAGGGELICRLSHWWMGGKLAEQTRDWIWLAASVAAVAAAPTLIFLFPDRVFWVADHFLWVLHVDYITEFFSEGAFLRGLPLSNLLVVLNPLVLLAIPMIVWAWRPGFPRPLKALLLLTLPAGLLTFGLSLAQIRWTELNYALWLASLVTVAAALALQPEYRWSWRQQLATVGFLAWVLLPNPISIISSLVELGWSPPPTKLQLLDVVTRDVAQRLRAREGNEPTTIVTGPNTTTPLIYWGGLQGLGTFYWENLAGLKANADIYGAPTPEKALQLLLDHKVKYLVTLSWDGDPAEYARLSHNLRANEPPPRDAFIYHMIKNDVLPSWLRPIYYQMPPGDAFKDVRAVMYEVVPNQSMPDAATRLAQWQLDDGNPDTAEKLLRLALDHDPSSLPALIALARLDYTSGHTPEFSVLMRRITDLLGKADSLELADRIDLALLLNVTKQTDLMEAQLHACLRDANARNLRRLPSDRLGNLLLLLQQSHLLNERPGLWPFANPLLPPIYRVNLLNEFSDMENSAHHAPLSLSYLRQALVLQPDSVLVLNRLAWLLATTSDDAVNDGHAALTAALQARQLDHDQHVNITDTLACAYAACGEYSQAIEFETECLQKIEMLHAQILANIANNHLDATQESAQKDNAKQMENLAAMLRAHLEAFQGGHPIRESN